MLTGRHTASLALACRRKWRPVKCHCSVTAPDCSMQPRTACTACRIDMNEVSNFCTGEVCSITASDSHASSPGDSLTLSQQALCCVFYCYQALQAFFPRSLPTMAACLRFWLLTGICSRACVRYSASICHSKTPQPGTCSSAGGCMPCAESSS